ncbi:AAA family ATPase [Falsihalocynthiibacter arcticus]|nr:AAA family ATPase [Falsihalocynthiibacter arcticus]
MDAEERKFRKLMSSTVPGGVHFVTGKNGSGKSRFFSLASKECAHTLMNEQSEGGRILCLSGTMHDKYAPSIYRAKSRSERVIYLGNKVNNNMISDVAPFRTLSTFLLRKLSAEDGLDSLSKKTASTALNKLKFQDRIGLKFRYSKGRKSDIADLVEPELFCSLTDIRLDNIEAIRGYITHLDAGDITLSDIKFIKEGETFGLADLSSGEKQYALSLLGMIYCGNPNCTVYFDEPENSLHPSWQMSIVKDLVEISDHLFPNSTIIVATHSPLITSSVRGAKVFTCNFPAEQLWGKSDLFGKPSDSVLRDQFNLYSSRSPEVYKCINRCLDLIARNQTTTLEFEEERDLLRSFDLQPNEDDPLHDVIQTILGIP